MVLATWSPQDELDFALPTLDAVTAIDAKTTKNDVEASMPVPDLFEAALKAGSVEPDRALVVGDSIWDVEAASAADLRCVGVETGGFSHHELSAAGAVYVHRDVQEMLDQIRTGPLRHLLPSSTRHQHRRWF